MTKTILTAAALVCAAAGAQAQVVTISTTNPGGLTHSIGSAIARVVTDTTDLNVVVVPAGGSPQPAVAGGEAECGLNVIFDVAYYVTGTAFYAGEGTHENLRLVAAILPSQVALYVRKDAPLQSVADLRGKRVPGGLNAQLAIGEVYETYLELAGLTRDDVETIPAQSIVQAADDFAASRNDTFLFSIGAAKVLEVDSSVGGLRALSIEATPENEAILSRRLPGAAFVELTPEAGSQIVAPTNIIAYDLGLFCANTVPDEVIATITRVVHENKPALTEVFKAMEGFDPARMAPEIAGLDYHPGAIAFYESAGMWPPKN